MYLTYIFFQLLIILLIGLSAYIVGRGVLGKKLGLSLAEEIPVSISLGFALMILVLFLVGVFQLLYLSVIIIVFGAATGFFLYREIASNTQAEFFGLIKPKGLLPWLAFGLTLVLVGPILLSAFSPPISSDEIRYHLPYALHFVETHGLSPDLALRYPFFTLNIDLFFVPGLLAGDDVTPHLLHFLLGAITALNCYAMTKKYTNSYVAFGTFLYFITLPAIVRLSGTAYIDLGLACFVSSSILCISCYKKGSGNSFIYCGAILFGAALGTKYLALAFLPLLIVWTYYHTGSWKSSGKFILLSLLVGSPWYLFNLFHSGNPISPFLGEIFGYWPLTQTDMLLHSQNLNEIGSDKSLVSLFKLPYNLLVNYRAFETFLPPYLVLFTLACLPATPFLKKELLPWFVLVIAALLIWFFSSQSIRYLTSFLPIICFLGAWIIFSVSRFICRFVVSDTGKIQTTGNIITLVILALLIGIQYRGNPQILSLSESRFRVEQREEYLRNALDEYGVIEFFNTQNMQGARIFQIRGGALLSYVRKNKVVGDVFGVYGMANYLLKYPDSKEGFIEELSDQGISYWVFRQNFLRRQSDWSTYLNDNLDVVFQDELFVVFAMPSLDSAG